MAKVFSAYIFFIFIILSLYTASSSGISVGFLYDARKDSASHLSLQETESFLESNKVLPSQFKILMTNSQTYLDTMLNTSGIAADLYLSQFEAQKLIKAKASGASLPESYLTSTQPSFIINSIIVSSENLEISSLLPTMMSIDTVLKNLKLGKRVKVSTMFPLSVIETMDNAQHRLLKKVMQILMKRKTSVTIEIVVYRKLSMGDAFVHSVIEKALLACVALPYLDIPLILHVKSSVALSGVEIADFTAKAITLINRHDLLRKRILELFVDISHLKIGQKKLGLEEVNLFPSARRELLNHGLEVNPMTRPRVHDSFTPVTNPVITPITVPSTNPPPNVITVPSTSPVTVYPTNPTMAPITIPSQNPVTTPITDPVTDPTPTPAATTPVAPITNPATTPVVPVTNPATTPMATFPVSPSIANPVTTYPVTPTVTTPYVAPVTVPSTTPATPSVTGQAYCVAKTGVPDQSLQNALDYACGIGNVDCSALQPTGSCYNPNTLQDHASYAFNSYYQKNPVSTSCDFGGTAMLVNANPSSVTCVYLSSSSVSTSTPASTNNPASTNSPASTYNPLTGSTTSSGTPVLNSNNPGSPDTAVNSYGPTGSVNTGLVLSAGWIASLFVLTIVFLTTNM